MLKATLVSIVLLALSGLGLARGSHVSATSSDAAATTVILVRHAEKSPASPADGKAGPGLSDAGKARAEALRDALRDASIDAIIVTQFRRTQETAAPLAALTALTPIVMEAKGDAKSHAATVADSVRVSHAGQTVLVVGHSNTVPAIIEALGGPAAADIDEDEFDNIFVVTLREGKAPTIVRARYGESSKPSP